MLPPGVKLTLLALTTVGWLIAGYRHRENVKPYLFLAAVNLLLTIEAGLVFFGK